MCDYSLHHVASRPAQAGDHLVVTSFPNTYTRGFTEVGEPDVAVCLMPGTELEFEESVERELPFPRLMRRLGFGRIGATMARFRQVNTDNDLAHHDALEFANGKIVLLTDLARGQRARVLQLPATAAAHHDEHHHHRPALVR